MKWKSVVATIATVAEAVIQVARLFGPSKPQAPMPRNYRGISEAQRQRMDAKRRGKDGPT